MARLYDNQGVILGGLHSYTTRATGGAPSISRTSLNPNFGPEETIPGLACSYGCLAYSYAIPLRDGMPGRSDFPLATTPWKPLMSAIIVTPAAAIIAASIPKRPAMTAPTSFCPLKFTADSDHC